MKFLSTLLVFACFCSVSGFGATANPSQDSTITVSPFLGGRDANLGKDQLYLIPGSASFYSYPVLQFDLSAYSGQVLTGSPTLNLHVNGTWGGNDVGPQTIGVYLLTGPWTEMGITWNNAPARGSSIGSATFSSITPGDLLTFTLNQAAVQSWIDSSSTNYGIEVYESTTPDHNDVYIDSREIGQQPPWLNFNTTTPEPGTFLMLGSGILGLAGVIRRKLMV